MIKNLLKDNRGDVYIQMMICLTVILIICVVMFVVSSSLVTKVWLDEQMTDIAKCINVSGTIYSDQITAIEDSIKKKMGGGEFEYNGDFLDDDKTAGLVQLNDKVQVSFKMDDYVVLNVGFFNLRTKVNVAKTAVSTVYYKTANGLID